MSSKTVSISTFQLAATCESLEPSKRGGFNFRNCPKSDLQASDSEVTIPCGGTSVCSVTWGTPNTGMDVGLAVPGCVPCCFP
ncbi:hypothetical protein AQUCO_01600012v1 [Aquilegia coerulea]|uniref:Uncharacterized protein n=1 Tax=Aquilegia coerulea TaxID=218851 RepID=A0A2G5DPV8_AQUCA|nr:hypothetical protein AQUCO_01600012v1 [Aquilegia coerulea]